MRQTVLTIALPVQPRSLDALRLRIKAMRDQFEPLSPGLPDRYDLLIKAVPLLHFASFMVFEDPHYDPLLTIELNFDGDAGPFLPQFEAPLLQPHLREIIRCCKRPVGSMGDLYAAITSPGSTLPLTPFLDGSITRPAVFHQGNRGLDRGRILDEQGLFADVQRELGTWPPQAAADAVAVHTKLRGALIGSHPWLAAPEPPRWTQAERVGDVAALLGFVALAFFILAIPGMVMALLMRGWIAILVCAAGTLLALAVTPGLIAALRQPREPEPAIPGLPAVPKTPAPVLAARAVGALVALVVYILLAALVLALPLVPLRGETLALLYPHAVHVAVVGFFTILLPVAIILFWLRWLEARDPSQDEPPLDPVKLHAIAEQEDQIAQNHMGSVVLIKPGVLRAVLVRAGLWGLGLYLRATATGGYLASMRTIHFAHWAILSNGARLAFFSNFDSSWESYLDDFIEKAHAGLTLAWSNGVGFPETRFLIDDGATNGRLFKAWARNSMAEGLFWFSAYKDLSVNQIERQARIAGGLRKPTLDLTEAITWACDL